MKHQTNQILLSIDLNESSVPAVRTALKNLLHEMKGAIKVSVHAYSSARCILLHIIVARAKYDELIHVVNSVMKGIKGSTTVRLDSMDKNLAREFVRTLSKADYVVDYRPPDVDKIIEDLMLKSEHAVHAYLVVPANAKTNCAWLKMRRGIPVEVCDMAKHRETCMKCRTDVKMLSGQERGYA